MEIATYMQSIGEYVCCLFLLCVVVACCCVGYLQTSCTGLLNFFISHFSVRRHYGPSAPNVPGANLYSVSEKGAGYFLSKKINEHGYINFQIGGIPTGTAEVGGKKMKFFLFHFLFVVLLN